MTATDVSVGRQSPTAPAAVAAGLAMTFGAATLLSVARPSELFPDLETAQQLMLGEAGWWAIALLVVCVIAADRSGRALGLRAPTLPTLLTGLAAAVGLLALFPAVQLLLQHLGLGLSQPASVRFSEIPVWLVIGMAVRAGVVEELLFRGYAVTRLEALTGRTWLAALLSLTVFVALHVKGWSAGHLIYVALAGGALTALYLWKRNLTANMVAHVLVDVAGLLLAKYAASAA